MALLKLADKYPVLRIEAACQKALTYTPRPSYKNVPWPAARERTARL